MHRGLVITSRLTVCFVITYITSLHTLRTSTLLKCANNICVAQAFKANVLVDVGVGVYR